jgi:SAM-dependent methyltransferase
MTKPAPWWSYDSVAGEYADVAVPRFEPLARALVAALELHAGERVADVGTGTGLVARLARAEVGAGGLVVGVDPSAGMLALGSGARVAGAAPRLPLRPGAFDAAAANLVLSHMPDPTEGAADVARTLRPGGRFACTAWAEPPGAADGNDAPEAAEIVASVRARAGLDLQPDETPARWEDDLRPRDGLTRTLAAAGFTVGPVEAVVLPWHGTVEEYVAFNAWGGHARFLRDHAGPARWEDAQRAVVDALHDRFGPTLRTIGVAWVARATRAPDGTG